MIVFVACISDAMCISGTYYDTKVKIITCNAHVLSYD